MRIERVTADEFGPFCDRSLDLAPGFTIIFGPNEAGKSRWHMALYAGLCGVRRGKGQPTREEREFRDLNHPWGSDKWRVTAIVTLEDGRRIELRHDLEDKVDVRATDLDTGRDVSDEIMFEGAPDGSQWLGLDRKSFLAVACVRQAEVLRVVESAETLKEYLQAAAATSRADTTAAAALERLDDFTKERIGSAWAPTKPLRRSQERLEKAEANLAVAGSQHEQYLARLRDLESLNQSAEESTQRYRVLQGAHARAEADSMEHRVDQAQDISEQFPDGPPSDPLENDLLAQQVAAALDLWEHRPSVSQLNGPSSDQLRQELETLPASPVGDLVPDPTISSAAAALHEANQALRLHGANRPIDYSTPPVSGVSAARLRELANVISRPLTPIDPGVATALNKRQAAYDEAKAKKRSKPLLIGGIVVIVVSVLLAALIRAAVIGVVLGIALLIWSRLGRGKGAQLSALEELHGLQETLGADRVRAEFQEKTQADAKAELSSRNLPMEPSVLHSLADSLDAASIATQALIGWRNREIELEAGRDEAHRQLAEALSARGLEPGGDLEGAGARYEADCRERAAIAQIAGRRSELTSALAARSTTEDIVRDAAQKGEQARARLIQVAEAAGLPPATDEVLVGRLHMWHEERQNNLGRETAARDNWTRLLALLDGKSLSDFEEEAANRRTYADGLAEGLTKESLDAVNADETLAARVEAARAEAERLNQAASQLRGEVAEIERRLPNVAEAEEERTEAVSERDRVQELDRVVKLTREFLEAAQERVHRDIAPILRSTVEGWLPAVTGNRYHEAIVDPETLSIKVRGHGSEWREVALLSHGTAEQIYLLLRVAMAKHLTKAGEICPLILDDVTVQCDSARKKAVLELLHELSKERQVVLFTQEEDVVNWADANLGTPDDAVVRLDPALIGV